MAQADADAAVPDRQMAEAIDTARLTVEIEMEGLRLLHGTIDGAFAETVERIRRNPGRVIVTGIGKSGHVGQKIAATLASTGTPAFFVHTAEAGHGDLGMIGQKDIVLAISNSGESREFRPLLQYCRRFNVFLVAMTANPQSALGRYADLILTLPAAQEACPLSLAPMTSTTLMMVMGDALAAALIRSRGFRRDDFAKFHPSGKLGAQLLRLAEVMEGRPELQSVPSVDVSAPIVEVIAAITRGRRGVTAVRRGDAFVGVITDGDLRRSLAERSIFERVAGELMTTNPLRISADHLAVDALAMCERHKVGALFVTAQDDDENIVGLVHLQDLLTLGIA
jgi:arabinose-5-phosphate isomerase